MRKALVLGRFQPLHIGHEYLFSKLKEQFDLILIGICTKPKDKDNPLNFNIRKKMIKNISKGFNHKIYEIPDINDPRKYSKYVRKIVKEFDKKCVVITGNQYTADCFEGYPIQFQKKKIDISSTALREAIINNKNWKRYIPPCNLELFHKEGVLKMIKKEDIKEKILKSKIIFKGNYIKSVEVRTIELENGKIASREIVNVSSAVAMLPITKDNNVILVKQFRSPIQKELIEIPAGIIDKGEKPIEAAKRELLEEVGAKGKLYEICEYHPSCGFANYSMTLYYALIKTKDLKQNLDESEILSRFEIPLEEAYSMVLDNKITDAKTQIAIRHYYNEIFKKTKR